ncbi:cytochrome c biogenesis protein ResB [Shimazuella sp. AN120528]|uniref:cytochrome c biogenesis protein ResB n=1 Tax=Shimazuella soli TaxID=1892854 RepID=UPI001F0E89E0|nr:cytochrome c biogenesis protein ResB [Shimazuella soli]MCH5584290.1 cytochrome c biogenesis protein ResB [Shimazuella soli]
MIENTKCECGHNNPLGTVLCEHCGRPLDEISDSKEKIDKEMRYEGKARRSLTYQTSIMDQVWNFFSSVKIAIVLIIITLIMSGIGTIFPQEQFIPSSSPDTYYEQTYGTLGKWFYQLGFSDMYSSWWFATLMSMIGISLVICSLDRVIPLYRALKNQKVAKSTVFIERQRISLKENMLEDVPAKIDDLADKLAAKRYHVRREGNTLLAEKGRFSRWGPYINHIGLIIFLVGILLRYLPGWNLDDYVWVQEGQTVRVPQTHYYVKNEGSSIEYYKSTEKSNKGPIVSKYRTKAVLYQKDSAGKLIPLTKKTILVNDPLNYQGLKLYQSDFRSGDLTGIKFSLIDRKTKKNLGVFSVNLSQISESQIYKVGDLRVKIKDYYPDFAIENNVPVTKSQDPNQPAFLFETIEKGKTKGENSLVISGMNFPNPKSNKYDIGLAGFDMVNTAGLMVRVEKSLPIYLIGGIISMIGLVMGFYWQHRRVWIRVQDRILYLGAHTNKNWFALRRELSQIGFSHLVKEIEK